MAKTTYKQALKIVTDHRNEESKKLQAEQNKQNKALVGTYWKFLNSYGSGASWWLYIKIIGVNRDGTPTCVEVEHTSHDNIEIKHTTRPVYRNGSTQKGLGDGYTKITKAQWISGTRKDIVKVLADYGSYLE